ncbi:MAG: hypothetical protein M0D53_01200 [Flavobacterium sp. JAD_PAG50586_2]|nr:MAG: hypothetical protein M0D53_01200 [Flavobacterium sp. JAD_PAG50586_2]
MKKQLAEPFLDELFGKEAASTFLSEHWPHSHHVRHGSMERFSLISKIDDFRNNERIIENLRDPVAVLWEDGRRETIADKARLLSLYRSKEAMFYIMDLTYYPEIEAMRCSLADELCIPKQFVGCEGFLANSNVNVDIHFDHETNFMLQLCGKKHGPWRPTKY